MPLNIDIQQILLHMLNFAVLFAVMYFILYKPVKQFMDKRNDYYGDLEEKSKAKTEESETIIAEYNAKLTEFNENIENEKHRIVSEANEEAAEIVDSARNEAKEIINKAKNEAKLEKESIVKAANREIAELAQEAAEKIIMQNSSQAYDSFSEIVSEDD